MATPSAQRPLTSAVASPSYGWIFSRHEDVIVFLCLPLAVSLALTAAAAALGWPLDGDSAYPATFFLYVLIDLAHQYSTPFLTLGFSDEYNRRKRFYWLAPPLICALLIALNAASPAAFIRTYAYYSAYHFIRQQYGWMSLAARRAPQPPAPADRFADSIAIYSASLGPLLYMCSTTDTPSWFLTGDLIALPPWLGSLSLSLTALIALSYLSRLLILSRRHALNHGKLFIYLKTLLIWGGAFVLTSDTLWGVALIIAHHGIPYLYMSARYIRRRYATSEGRLAWRLAPPKPSPQISPPSAPPSAPPRPRWLPLSAWVIASIWLLAAAHFILEAHLSDWLAPLHVAWLDTLTLGVLYPSLAGIGIFHFIVDSFFWKAKHNPHLRALSRPPQTPEPTP
jgi:hypothetical protein